MIPPVTPATYDFPELTRGDTFPETLFFHAEFDGAPMDLASGRLHVRDRLREELVLAWTTADASMIVDSGDITLGLKTTEVMAAVPPGEHLYDLEVVTADGQTMTLAKGLFPISKDYSR